MADQNERAYQKQSVVFEYGKHRAGVSKRSVADTSKVRLRRVGLGFKTPKQAIEGKYVDKKCPFRGNVAIRGRILRGRVISTKMNKTVIVRRDSLFYIQKYQRYEKRHSNVAAHASPAFLIKEGDIVTIGECRPLSKTVHFNVLELEPQTAVFSQAKKRFRIF